MTRDPKLTDDLAALAAAERQLLGEPPGVEQLLALRDGALPEAEAERLHDRLAVDPESAALYLELKRGADLKPPAGGAADDVSDAEVEEAWRKLSPILDADAPAAGRQDDDAFRPVSLQRRDRGRVFAMAATLVLAAGAVWFLAEKDGSTSPRDAKIQRFAITGDELRDNRLRVPANADVVTLEIDTAALDAPGDFVVELLDSSDLVILRQRAMVEAGQQDFDFAVATDSLEEGETYRLVVRPADASPADRPPIDVILQPVFEATPKAGGTPAPDSCVAINKLVSEAAVLRQKGQRQAAEDSYHDLLDRVRDLGCPIQEARVWNGLATLATLEGRLLEALRRLDRADDALSSAAPEAIADFDQETKWAQAAIEVSRGATYSRLGWFPEARKAFHRTRTLYRRNGVDAVRQANLQLQLARVYRLEGMADEAETTIEEAHVFGQETDDWRLRAALWQESARQELESGRLDAAEQALDQAVAAAEKHGGDLTRANIFVDVAEFATRQGRWDQSLEWADRTLDITSTAESQDLNLEAHARYVRSIALAGRGDLEDATRVADAGLALLEAARDVWQDQGLQFFALRRKHYRHRLDLAARAGDPEDAWAVFEQGLARGLLDSVAARERRAESRPSPELRGEIARARRDLLAAVRQLDNWEPAAGEPAQEIHETRVLKRRIALRSLQDAGHREAGLPPPPAEVGAGEASGLLGPDTLGLAFARGVDGLHLLVLNRRLELITLETDRARLQALVAGIHESLEPRAAREARERLEARVRELSRLLLGPLAGSLDRSRRLAIVAEAPLDRLPFEVLRHPGTGRYLVESHEVAYLPSFSVLGALRRRAGACAPPESTLLAMGDAVFGPRDPRWPADVADYRSADEAMALRRLPGTATEVARVAHQIPGTEAITGKAATRERFLAEAPAHRVIHLASHAVSHADIPERSRIAFSCIDTEDAAIETCDLYFQDALALELCGQTVVLSACATAGGLAVEGEGILGLPWAFLRAGASTVVASLWQVTDGATAELMSTFHRHLRDPMGPAGALRQAKLALIERGDPPSTWAPFVLLGDG